MDRTTSSQPTYLHHSKPYNRTQHQHRRQNNDHQRPHHETGVARNSRKRRLNECEPNTNDHVNTLPPSKRHRYNDYHQTNHRNNNNNHYPHHQHAQVPHHRNIHNVNTHKSEFRKQTHAQSQSQPHPPPHHSQPHQHHNQAPPKHQLGHARQQNTQPTQPHQGNKPRGEPANSKKKFEMEQDFHRITQRMRQVDIGKNTPEYQNYLKSVPKHQREAHHPRTPNARQKMPNKWWKTAVNRWRKALHAFDLDAPVSNESGTHGDNAQNAESAEQTKFCCEKCSDEFSKFDEWQKHREQCDGSKANSNDKENESPRSKESREEKSGSAEKKKKKEFDLLNLDDLDEDIDLDFMSSLKPKPEVDSDELKDLALLKSLNDILEDSEDDDAII